MQQKNNIQLSSNPAVQKVYDSLMTAFVRLGHLLRHSSEISHSYVDSANHFGDI